MLSPGRQVFRRWRRTRPFWAGLLTGLGGVFLVTPPLAPLGLMLHEGGAAASGFTLGSILVLGGTFFWWAPQQRTFVSLVCALCSVIAFVTSNLGGFGFGTLLGLVGASMAFGWHPATGTDEAPPLPGSSAAAGPPLGHGQQPAGQWSSGALALSLLAGPPAAAPAAMAPAPPMVSQVAPLITASRLAARGLVVKGSATLTHPNGSERVLQLHADVATLTRYHLVTVPPDPPFSLSFDLTTYDVDIYASYLEGRLILGPISIPIRLSPASIPVQIPLDVRIPTLVISDARAGEALILSPRADISGLTIRAAVH